MRIVVLGAGLMGKEVARDLIANQSVEKVYLADANRQQAQQFVDVLQTNKIEVVAFDANDMTSLKAVISRGHVVVNALFYSFNEKVVNAAIEVGVHALDLGGHIGQVTEHILALHDKAQVAGITVIPDLGLAPGMINILTGYGASKIDKVTSIKQFVGGIPIDPIPPLYYTQVFSLEGVFDHYTEPSQVVQNGVLKEVPSLSGIESVYFEGFGMLEAFYTAGGFSTLYKTFPYVQTLEYKTVRYKGHAEKFQLLVDLGFLDKNNEVQYGTQAIPVRQVVREALTKKLALGNKEDAVLLRVIVAGEKGDEQVVYEYETIVKKDVATNETAMARTTANTISVVAQMIGAGKVTKRGVYPPEQIVPGELYIQEMAKRGIHIKETFHRSSMIIKG